MHCPVEPHALKHLMHCPMEPRALKKPFSFIFPYGASCFEKSHALPCGASCSGNSHAFSYGAPCFGNSHALSYGAPCFGNLHTLPCGASCSVNPFLQVLILGSRKNPTTLHWPHHLLVNVTHYLVQIHLPYGFKQHKHGLNNTFTTTISSFKQVFFFWIQIQSTFSFSFITQTFYKTIIFSFIKELL